MCDNVEDQRIKNVFVPNTRRRCAILPAVRHSLGRGYLYAGGASGILAREI